MLGINLVFIILVPVLLSGLSAYASKPDRAQYGELDDYRVERYRWCANVGLDTQLAGLTTLLATILDRGLSNSTVGVAAVLIYALLMAYGFVRYRDHRYRSQATIGSLLRNEPFVIGIALFVVLEGIVFSAYLMA